MNIAIYAIAALHIIGVVFSITSIGKPRKPITAGTAAFTTVISGIIIATLLTAAQNI